jgi:hypothetical protein
VQAVLEREPHAEIRGEAGYCDDLGGSYRLALGRCLLRHRAQGTRPRLAWERLTALGMMRKWSWETDSPEARILAFRAQAKRLALERTTERTTRFERATPTLAIGWRMSHAFRLQVDTSPAPVVEASMGTRGRRSPETFDDAPRRGAAPLSRQARRSRGRSVDRSGSSRRRASTGIRPASGRASGRAPGRAAARRPPRRGRSAG